MIAAVTILYLSLQHFPVTLFVLAYLIELFSISFLKIRVTIFTQNMYHRRRTTISRRIKRRIRNTPVTLRHCVTKTYTHTSSLRDTPKCNINVFMKFQLLQ